MKTLLVVTLILVTFSMIKCVKKNENKMKPVVTTTPISLDNDDGKNVIDLMEVMIDCNDTFRVEMPYLDTFNKSGSFPDETDRTPKCFVRCVLEQVEAATEDGQFDVNRTADVFPEIRDIPREKIIEMATPCAERSETCKCERSYQYLKCLLEKVIDNYDTT